MRALLGTASYLCEVLVLKLRTVLGLLFADGEAAARCGRQKTVHLELSEGGYKAT